METFTYFNIITLSIFTWYTIDTDKNQATVTNISVAITFIQLLLVISYHVCKYTNHKVFSRIQETAVCKKLNEMSEQGKQKRCNSQPLPDEDIHDYNIPQVLPKPVEPTYSVVEIPKPDLAPPPPPLEEIKEEPEHESQQQLSEQDDVTVVEENQSALMDDVIVVKENQSALIDEDKVCINNRLGIEIAECDDTTESFGNRMEYN